MAGRCEIYELATKRKLFRFPKRKDRQAERRDFDPGTTPEEEGETLSHAQNVKPTTYIIYALND
eukprot:6196300-Pleurochrysis_carterae.AAC.1